MPEKDWMSEVIPHQIHGRRIRKMIATALREELERRKIQCTCCNLCAGYIIEGTNP